MQPGHGRAWRSLACAAARAVIAILEEENLVEGAREKGDHLAGELRALVAELPNVCELERGQGLIRGLMLRPGYVARDVVAKAALSGLLLTGAGERVLRFVPPLVVTKSELSEAVKMLRGVLTSL